MKKTKTAVNIPQILVILIMLIAVSASGCLPIAAKNSPNATVSPVITHNPNPSQTSTSMVQTPVATTIPSAVPSSAGKVSLVVYKNTDYGFNFVLPQDWNGYTIIKDQWKGSNVQSGKVIEAGPMISIRNPKWTTKTPYQDIPILVLTIDQWKSLRKGTIHIGAAPIGPSELGRNSKYVFALPARYNYSYPAGWKEVESYLAGKPIQTFNPNK